MSNRVAESGPNTVSDAVELALYSTAVLFIVLLWVYVPAAQPDLPHGPRCVARRQSGGESPLWPGSGGGTSFCQRPGARPVAWPLAARSQQPRDAGDRVSQWPIAPVRSCLTWPHPFPPRALRTYRRNGDPLVGRSSEGRQPGRICQSIQSRSSSWSSTSRPPRRSASTCHRSLLALADEVIE